MYPPLCRMVEDFGMVVKKAVQRNPSDNIVGASVLRRDCGFDNLSSPYLSFTALSEIRKTIGLSQFFPILKLST